MEPANLILRFKNGDRSAFKEIYVHYYAKLYSFIKKYVESREDIEDIIADVFIKLWDLRSKVDSRSTLESFLYTTSRGASIDLLRRQKVRDKNRESLIHVSSYGQIEENNFYSVDEVKAEVLKMLYEEIENLPSKCKQIFKLAYYKDLKNAEIAVKLNCSEQTVKNQKSIAIKYLKLTFLSKKFIEGCILIAISLVIAFKFKMFTNLF